MLPKPQLKFQLGLWLRLIKKSNLIYVLFEKLYQPQTNVLIYMENHNVIYFYLPSKRRDEANCGKVLPDPVGTHSATDSPFRTREIESACQGCKVCGTGKCGATSLAQVSTTLLLILKQTYFKKAGRPSLSVLLNTRKLIEKFSTKFAFIRHQSEVLIHVHPEFVVS